MTTHALYLLLILSFTALVASEIHPADQEATLAFYHHLSNTGALVWSEDIDLCLQNGIVCDESSPQRIVEISLSSMGLEGSVATELGGLTALQILNLQNNSLSGQVPKNFGFLTSLTSLYLNQNEFSGNLPREILSIATLKTLYLANNDFFCPVSDYSQISETDYLEAKSTCDSIEPSHGWIIGLTILMAVMVLVVGTFIFIIIRNKDYQEIPESTPETTA